MGVGRTAPAGDDGVDRALLEAAATALPRRMEVFASDGNLEIWGDHLCGHVIPECSYGTLAAVAPPWVSIVKPDGSDPDSTWAEFVINDARLARSTLNLAQK